MKNNFIKKVTSIFRHQKVQKVFQLFFIRIEVFLVALIALLLAKGGIMIAQFLLADLEMINLELIVGGILGIFLATLFIIIVQKYIDKSQETLLGLLYERNMIQNAFKGIITSGIIFSLILLLLYYTHHITIIPTLENITNEHSSSIIMVGLFYFILAFTEELIFRGYAIMRLEKFFNPLTVLVVQSFYFTLSSMFTFSLFIGKDLGSVNLSYFIFVFIISFFFGVIRLRSHSLWFVIFFHGLWNFYQEGLTSLATDGDHPAFMMVTFLKHTPWSDVSGNIEGGFIGMGIILIITLLLIYPLRKSLFIH